MNKNLPPAALHEVSTAVANDTPIEVVKISDWDELMSAVKIRLCLTAGELSAQDAAPQSSNAAGRFQASVLECVDALEQLQIRLNLEIDTSRQLKSEVLEVREALSRARNDLVSMQAGERRARHRATHDSLTLLGNRGFFRNHLEKVLSFAVEPEHSLAIFYLDLDGFKLVNDTHGHDAGDQLLKVVAARLNQAMRVDDVVCRLGGDEFACILGGSSGRPQLDQLARKLFNSIAATCKIGECEINVHPSIGIALWPQDGKTTDALLKSADAAMYRAKRLKSGYAFSD